MNLATKIVVIIAIICTITVFIPKNTHKDINPITITNPEHLKPIPGII